MPGASFDRTKFLAEADFSKTEFLAEAQFSRAIFSNNAYFSCEFVNTDLTGIRFSANTKWGGKRNFQVIEEKWLEDGEKPHDERRVSLGGVLSVYRNLRENYEFRRRYDEAGSSLLEKWS